MATGGLSGRHALEGGIIIDHGHKRQQRLTLHQYKAVFTLRHMPQPEPQMRTRQSISRLIFNLCNPRIQYHHSVLIHA